MLSCFKMVLNIYNRCHVSSSYETNVEESNNFDEVNNCLLIISLTFIFVRLCTRCIDDMIENTADPIQPDRPIHIEGFKVERGVNDQHSRNLKSIMRAPAKVIYRPSKTYENIKANLIHFEDNGNFQEFDSFSLKMLQKHQGDFDIVVAVTVQQAQCALYRNALGVARRLARKALELVPRTTFPPLFEAQTLVIMSNVSRYTPHELGRTEEYLRMAFQCLECVYSFEDLARCHEMYGSYLDKFLGTVMKPCNEHFKEDAVTSFKKMDEIASRDSKSRVREKNLFYSLLRTARILLDSNSPIARREHYVPQKDLDHADAACLDVRKHDLWGSMPRGSKIQFQLVESDLFYRQGKFEDALELLEETLNEVKDFGFKTEGPKIEKRMKEIQENIAEKLHDVPEPNSVDGAENNNGSFYGSDSSQSGSDVFSSQYF